MLFNPGDHRENLGDPQPPEAEGLRAEVDRLRERERLMVELLGSDSSDQLLHDLRNLLNEVQLLRLLCDEDKA